MEFIKEHTVSPLDPVENNRACVLQARPASHTPRRLDGRKLPVCQSVRCVSTHGK
jgi:hypothetical protein